MICMAFAFAPSTVASADAMHLPRCLSCSSTQAPDTAVVEANIALTACSETHCILMQVSEDGLWVGSSVTLSDLMDKMRSVIATRPAHQTSACRALLHQLKYFAGNQIRNTASVGGNIVTGSPISDTCPLYMACGATFVLKAQGQPERTVLAENFFLGYRSTPSVICLC